jgi:hypothetical protein
VETVRGNAKKNAIHFDGIKGRERCIEVTYDMTDKDSNVKNLSLFADINVRMLQHTFVHPKGLIFRHSICADRPCWYVTRSFRRHALEKFGPAGRCPRWPLTGELTTQHGRPNYPTCAAKPSCVGKTLDDAALGEIVNVNVEVRQQF